MRDARGELRAALRADSAKAGGPFGGKADGVAAWTAYRLAVWRLEGGDAGGALALFSRVARTPANVPDSLRMEAERAVFHTVSADGVAGLDRRHRERLMVVLDGIERRAMRRGLIGVAARADSCGDWLRATFADGQAVDLPCAEGEAGCPAPRDPNRLGLWLAALCGIALGLWWNWAHGREAERVWVARAAG